MRHLLWSRAEQTVAKLAARPAAWRHRVGTSAFCSMESVCWDAALRDTQQGGLRQSPQQGGLRQSQQQSGGTVVSKLHDQQLQRVRSEQ